MDNVLLTKHVLIVADYFTMIHTPVLHEENRQAGEGDEDFAVRLTCEFMHAYYGWDVAAVATSIGVMDDEDGEDE
jgi:hypothetical protein